MKPVLKNKREIFLPITPFCQWCNDKAASISKIFAIIWNSGRYHPYYNISFFPVISHLRYPLKVSHVVNFVLGKFSNYVTSYEK